jgi:hypothetical protein
MDLIEHDLARLERLTDKGMGSFAAHEEQLRNFLLRTPDRRFQLVGPARASASVGFIRKIAQIR